jgi:hypothetical protein
MPNPTKPTYQTLEEYRTTDSSRASVWRSAEALRWTIRKHRSELVEAGALVYPTNRPLIVPEKFDLAVLAIGERNARNRSTR